MHAGGTRAAVYDYGEMTGMPTPKAAALVSAIRAGEDTELELKEVVFRGDRISFGADKGRATSKLAEVFVSMANTRGGTIVMGVRDSDRAVVGIDPEKRDLLEQFVVNVATTNCVPMIVPALDWEFLPAEDDEPRLCLIIDVPVSRFDVHQTSDGRFLQRIGSHRHLIPAERLARLLSARRMADPIEERPVFGASLDDLHELRLEMYFRDRFPDWSKPDDWTSTLLAHKLAAETDAGVTPTHLGVLLFCERPDRYLPGAYVDLAAYRSAADGDSADSRRVVGPLPEQIGQVLTYFGVSPLVPTSSRKEPFGRRDFPSYVHVALQEAVVNAVVHRDYEVRGSQIIIRLFPDRIEFQNPGALYNTLTVENVYAGCQPARRNQFLAGFLRDYKSPLTETSYMEARGEGFLKLVRASERLSGRRPELEQIGEATKLTIFAAQNDALSQFVPGAGGGVEAVRQRRPRRGEPAVSTPNRSPAAAAGGWDSAGIETALRRAAARARREAAEAGVPVVVFRDGEIVIEKPDRESGCAPSRRTDVDSPAADLEKPGREPAPHPGRGFPNPARDSDG